MTKRIVAMVLALGVALCGCGENSGVEAGVADGIASGAEGMGGSDGIGTEAEGLGGSDGIGTGAESFAKGNETADGTEGADSGGNGNTAGDGEAVSGNSEEAAGGREAAGNGAEASGQGAGEGAEGAAGTRVMQAGPYGEISIMLPDGWKYKALPMDSEELINGDYGIHFYPEDAAEGFVELAYIDFFGVCGTGLAQEDAEIAGSPAIIGTYDGHPYWNFVSFREGNDGVVALTYQVEAWWDAYGDAATEILDTLIFDRNEKEGGAYVFKKESENQEIGLYLSLKNVSAAGATLIFNQFDADAPTGELQDGDDFILERYIGENWEEVPVIVEGDYGFHDIAYNIPKEETTERALSWEWLYGQLAPGEYRIGKSVLDFRKTADYDKYTIYAYFILE